MNASTLQDWQSRLSVSEAFGPEFRDSRIPHKHCQHAFVHMLRSVGQIAAVIDALDHGASGPVAERIGDELADLIIDAMRMANTCPGARIDLQLAVARRLVERRMALEPIDPPAPASSTVVAPGIHRTFDRISCRG